jgi:hypothetical protein
MGITWPGRNLYLSINELGSEKRPTVLGGTNPIIADVLRLLLGEAEIHARAKPAAR